MSIVGKEIFGFVILVLAINCQDSATNYELSFWDWPCASFYSNLLVVCVVCIGVLYYMVYYIIIVIQCQFRFHRAPDYNFVCTFRPACKGCRYYYYYYFLLRVLHQMYVEEHYLLPWATLWAVPLDATSTWNTIFGSRGECPWGIAVSSYGNAVVRTLHKINFSVAPPRYFLLLNSIQLLNFKVS